MWSETVYNGEDSIEFPYSESFPYLFSERELVTGMGPKEAGGSPFLLELMQMLLLFQPESQMWR